ncbi:MAG: hypothetical protein K0S99_3396, partial [Thermomicrobiales bacterium]|nr:hypothetical protein [Thermomicrobiales bacterium]
MPRLLLLKRSSCSTHSTPLPAPDR